MLEPAAATPGGHGVGVVAVAGDGADETHGRGGGDELDQQRAGAERQQGQQGRAPRPADQHRGAPQRAAEARAVLQQHHGHCQREPHAVDDRGGQQGDGAGQHQARQARGGPAQDQQAGQEGDGQQHQQLRAADHREQLQPLHQRPPGLRRLAALPCLSAPHRRDGDQGEHQQHRGDAVDDEQPGPGVVGVGSRQLQRQQRRLVGHHDDRRDGDQHGEQRRVRVERARDHPPDHGR